jgi:hypothetical protein
MRTHVIALATLLVGCSTSGNGDGDDNGDSDGAQTDAAASGAATSGPGATGPSGGPGATASGAGGGGIGGATTGSGGSDLLDPLPPGNWTLKWSDDFDGTSLDTTRWATQSDSYWDQCQGNQGDHKLEYNLPKNLAVDGGVLTITAQREDYQAPSGIEYAWTSGLITTGHACGNDPPNGGTVQPGDYLQTRTKLPGDLGMWPALWTWADEVDVYEYHPDNPMLLELTNHTGETDGKYYNAGVDLSQDWHYLGALVGADQVVWYLDGQPIFTSPKGFVSDGAAIIVNLSVVDGEYHPLPVVDVAKLEVDSVKVFSPAD